MHALTFEKKHSHPHYVKSSVPTWGQIKALSEKGENVLRSTHSPITPENLFLDMVAIFTCISAVGGQVYWVFIPHPPLLRLVEWSKRGLIVFTDDSTHLLPPWKSTGPNHPSEEGTAMNISLDMKCCLCALVIQPLVFLKAFKYGWAYYLLQRKVVLELDYLRYCL
jgi:hypothetical protein